MGCTQSKIENEEAVSRCKDRKIFMKEAVSSRNAFAAAHSAYAMSLKNTGAALSDFAHHELHHHAASSSSSSAPSAVAVGGAPPSEAVAPQQAPFENLPPPPPPLPNFPASPLQRAATMPEMKMPKQEARAAGPTTIMEEEEGEIELELAEKESLVRKKSSREQKPRKKEDMAAPPPRPSTQMMDHSQDSTWDYFFAPMPAPTLAEREDEVEVERKVFEEKVKRVEEEEEEDEGPPPPPPMVKVEEEKPVEVPVPVPEPAPAALIDKKVAMKKGVEGGRRVVGRGNLIQIFENLDDHFLKASESAHEVSKMLEATRLHYHSNFADNRGHIDHSARVLRVITWNRSFKGLANNFDDGKDDFDSEEHETHATVLDKMLAWEKKLYDEVKAGELMKFEYQKKVALLNSKKKRGSSSESLEKLKAAVSHLHTRYIVDMQSMDSTVSEINRLRDEQLYPKLVQLVSGMAAMWDRMRDEHEGQSKIVFALRSLDISQSPRETSEHHHGRTVQLWYVVQEWHEQLSKLMVNQRAYIKALNHWLKLNLIPIDSSLKEKVSSPSWVPNPPIQGLLMAWEDRLDKLPDEVGRAVIKNFAAVIHAIVNNQEEEMKMKEKCEATRKELSRRTKQFEDWYNKYLQRKMPDEVDPERTEDQSHKDPAVEERVFVVDQLKKQLEEEEEAYARECLRVREKSLGDLKTNLPDLFRAMSEVSLACSEMYRYLKSITQRQR